MINRQTFEMLTFSQLKSFASKAGFPNVNHESHKTLLEKVCVLFDAPKTEVLPALDNPKDDNLPAPVNTKEQIKIAIAAQTERGLQAWFNDDTQTWLFRATGASVRRFNRLTNQEEVTQNLLEDSGTYNQPLKIIVKCAESVCRILPKINVQERVLTDSERLIGYSE